MKLITYRKPSYLEQWLNQEVAPRKQAYLPKADVSESEAGFEINLILPGFTREEIEVNLKDNELTITGTLKEELKESNFLRRKGSIADFQRRFHLPEGINEEAVTASYEAGILSLFIPKKEKEVQKRQISVK